VKTWPVVMAAELERITDFKIDLMVDALNGRTANVDAIYETYLDNTAPDIPIQLNGLKDLDRAECRSKFADRDIIIVELGNNDVLRRYGLTDVQAAKNVVEVCLKMRSINPMARIYACCPTKKADFLREKYGEEKFKMMNNVENALCELISKSKLKTIQIINVEHNFTADCSDGYHLKQGTQEKLGLYIAQLIEPLCQ